MIAGFANNTGVYPAPTITVQQLAARLNASIAVDQQSVAAHNIAKQTTVTDRETLKLLADDMKTDIKYAEMTVGNDALKLQLIGWDANDGDTPLAPPGQPRYFEALKQGEGTISFDWKAPEKDDGGKIASYCIERRERPNGAGQGEPSNIVVAVL